MTNANKIRTKKTLISTIILTMILASCGRPEGSSVILNKNVAAGTTINTNLHTDNKNQVWIPLDDAVKGLNLRMKMDKQDALIGYSDVMYSVKPNSKFAMSLGRSIQLDQAPTYLNKKIYMTPNALAKLLQTDIVADTQQQAIQVKAWDKAKLNNGNVSPKQGNGNFKVLDIGQNQDELISYAKKFLGVPYEFGAPPYEQSKTFDCSSYTRHILSHFGSDLPRLAREQANVGTPVSRDQLKVGDLIFFTVPGRFANDKVPGHVGIYIGSGNFIHTWGEPGVTINTVDSGYWHDMLLFMRRVL
ncbi:cell wall-associated NlpC family hydrolase [Paenibacillus turicensis]|uniref:Cell wall-associated NlpC family hydrolase n=1 Tax=Paenibacillus turicensis TaxID=160487 RepID=A0ABS4FTS3_9BACL|nr:C40 family peptidase [Paenibacillus turicensis]MBP1905849.1 cell wall-associated NlpC family hydrolase [Paenibacillus turicensis]